jgi:hypothetical protein
MPEGRAKFPTREEVKVILEMNLKMQVIFLIIDLSARECRG